ncbi:hypothetical protein FE257_000652 [Aspergillus nanangensis]|uniref:Peptidase S33 tripeptidyl aminopeptidase-like C-terminal domain-containing protein n=1 Tax=Aspergillus nanangensis TaxID=2582783 RepID=A0AAD4CEU7_ASPNN|nr:hypothetical protein FE257_000652 [Aspergillus nanangensis]
MLLSGLSTVLLVSGLTKALPHSEKRDSGSSSLDWAPCDLDFPDTLKQSITVPVDCAKLEVPLDYTNEDSDTFDLQLVKIKATKEPVKGSIIFNPGGPGASGVEEVVQKGPLYGSVFGGHYNVIGFDARGTGRTMPFACEVDNVETKPKHVNRRDNTTFLAQPDGYELLRTKAWHDAGVFADACYEQNKDIGKFLSTPFVARDMLKIVDALGEDGQLRFWGRSYSTVLGQTFAAMFPDRVDRMLLDSVVIGEHYYSGEWLSANRDTQLVMWNFFRECVNAGAERCPLASFKGPSTTPEDLVEAIGEVFQELKDNPILLPKTYIPQNWWQPGDMPLLPELQYYIMSNLYRPDQYPYVYSLIEGALKRNWTTWKDLDMTQRPPSWHKGFNAFHGIGCADSTLRRDSPEEMYNLVQAQAAQGTFATGFAPQSWVCAQWQMDAAEKFEGKFKNINTSYPIMFANSYYDPITPLGGAFEVAAGFEKSRLLVHKGHGHGVMSHPSSCTIKAIGDYFANGTLPEIGTVCEPDQTAWEYSESLFAAASNSSTAKRSLDNGQRKVMRDVYQMARREALAKKRGFF